MDWEKELSGQLTAALAGLTPAPFPPDDRWNSLTFLDLEGAEAGKRWKKLAARALKRAKTFEIHCWSEEPEAVSLALEYGEMRVSLPMVTRGFSPGCLPLASTSAAARPTL